MAHHREDRVPDRLRLTLCDITSVYFEGSKCPLAKRGYSRDGKRGKLQIVFALLCDREGCPVAVEVFRGNTADPGTLGAQIEKLRKRFSLSRVVLVGDRGLLTNARIREEVRPAGRPRLSRSSHASTRIPRDRCLPAPNHAPQSPGRQAKKRGPHPRPGTTQNRLPGTLFGP